MTQKQNKRPHILLTNDDGINAPGLRYLWQSLKDTADLTIIAPENEQSGAGLSTTVRRPLRIEKRNEFEGARTWSVSGTPADCVKIGLNVLMEQPPDLIMAGINQGSNAGRNILYSGTVAGVIEGVMHDIPGAAFSCWDYYDTIYDPAVPIIPQLLRYLVMHPLRPGTFLNVNFPSHRVGPVRGIKLTRQGKEYWAENPDRHDHPEKEHLYYWLGVKVAEFKEEEDCDISWLKKGYATVVPVYIQELTDHHHLNERRSAFDNLMGN